MRWVHLVLASMWATLTILYLFHQEPLHWLNTAGLFALLALANGHVFILMGRRT